MNTFCGYFNQSICRSCDLINHSYVEQIHQKEAALKKALHGMKLPAFDESFLSEPIGFRNKAKFQVTGSIDHPNFGLIGDGNLDDGKDLGQCLLHKKAITDALPILKDFLKVANLEPYRISDKKGELKAIIIFAEDVTKEMYVRFILRSKESLDRIRKHLHFLLERLQGLKVVTANIQPIPHAILEGEEEFFFTSEKTIRYQLGSHQFNLGPKSFVQTNQKVAEKLYLEASSWLTKIGSKKLIELYCGQGFFTFLSKGLELSVGIEINKEAVDVANAFAKENVIEHVQFIHSDAGNVSNIIEKIKPDTILVNPPRKGLGGATALLKTSNAQHIIYSSCDYQTLGEDLRFLKDDYQIEKIKIFDMFPQTSHFETLVLLTKTSSAG